MQLLTLPFPNIDPVALSLGPIAIKWYGLAYACGLLLGWQYVRQLLANKSLWRGGEAPTTVDRTDDLLLYMTLGVVLGGRLGYVLFYNPAFYLAHPLDIFKVWNGGMSFHGGFIGSVVALLAFCRQHSAPVLSVFDVVATVTPFGIFFGRLANFINSELWGRPSSVAWAMVFPDQEAGNVPRHPSQLYEATLEGLVLFAVCWWLIHKRGAFKHPGLVAGTFTAGYGIARAFCELFREPDAGHWATAGLMTPGILYSLPMIAAGIVLVQRSRASHASSSA
jgi:phosphatidylglycerol---prolipoprotein diacylglyceryl transferase